MTTWPKSFREGVTDRFDAPYERTVFWHCLHRRSLPIAAAVYLINRDYFKLDFQTLRQLGLTRSLNEFREELEGYRYVYRREGGFFRKSLRVRLSGKRLMRMATNLFPEKSS
jgi:hypothetical protein